MLGREEYRVLLWLFFLWPDVVKGQRLAQPIREINSEHEELMPQISPDGKTLYFVRTAHPQNIGGPEAGQDIWFSQWLPSENTWSSAKNIGVPLNTIFHNAVVGASAAGDKLWLSGIYQGKNKTAPGLSFTTQTKSGWSKPQAISIQNFKPKTGAISFYMANDSVLLLAMQTDSLQQEDLFFSRHLEANTWSEPKSLGAKLNTSGFEIAPFLGHDGQTLYFTSTGHGGFGNADIFKTMRLDNTWQNWSEPVNLGKEVNSAGFDGYFVLHKKTRMAYFTSEGDNREDTDIFMISLDDTLGKQELVRKNVPHSASLEIKSKAPDTTLLEPVNKPLLVYFELSSANLFPATEEALRTFLAGKTQLPIHKWVLTGHADDTGTNAQNILLSEKRAAAVANYLVRNGVARSAIQIKAVGSKQPIAPNNTSENKARNRRVEVVWE